MAHRIGIVGASGYAGAELVRLLGNHPAMELGTLAAATQAGRDTGELFPNLVGAGRLEAVDVPALARHDLVFLATPHGASADLAGELRAAGTRVVDLSGAFRLDAAGFEVWYGQPHPRPELTPGVYGLTEHTRAAVADAGLVANPGCYVTAALLGLVPVVDLLEADTVVVDGKSGTSGAGRSPADHLHFSHVHGDVTAYGAPKHRHTGELETWLAALGGDAGRVSFIPHLLPMARGLLTTVYARLRGEVDRGEVRAALEDRYAGEPFVSVLAPGSFPHTKAVSGSNGCHIGVTVDERTGRVVIVSAIDNLGKGAAGQALQNANLMLACDETLGLDTVGVYP